MNENIVQRFLSVDPLASEYPSISPYAYVLNNPLKFIDPTGMKVESTHLDDQGNVIAEYDDGDDGVYVHSSGTTISDVESAYSSSNTSAGGSFIGDLGGVVDVSDIYSNLLSENMEIAGGMWNPYKFKELVRNKGDWDYKNNKNTIYGLGNDGKTQFNFQGELMEAQDIGNHHFGAVAHKFGFPIGFALRQAGKAQIASGTSKLEWQRYKTYEIPGNWKTGSMPRTRRMMVAPFGDDPRDQSWIKAGYNYAK